MRALSNCLRFGLIVAVVAVVVVVGVVAVVVVVVIAVVVVIVVVVIVVVVVVVVFAVAFAFKINEGFFELSQVWASREAYCEPAYTWLKYHQLLSSHHCCGLDQSFLHLVLEC